MASVILCRHISRAPAKDLDASMPVAICIRDQRVTFAPRLADDPNLPFLMWVGDHTHG